MNPIKKNHDAMLRTGALALAAAGASTQANAATVQITFNNSFISTTSGNHLVTDFGGDGVANLNGVLGIGFAAISTQPGRLQVGVVYQAHGIIVHINGYYKPSAGVSVGQDGLVGITFVDNNIRSGRASTGYLDVGVAGVMFGDMRVTMKRLIFDDATGGAISGLSVNDAAYPEFGAAVPEPSGLGLLALGAGGLLARRRRAMAA